MSGNTSENRGNEQPDWYRAGLDHVWLPYAQMKTAPPPLAVVGTEGCRIRLADGRELIDGIASWWTACHGYNHPHIRAAVEDQLARMPHVMFGGMVHEPALTLARRLTGLMAPADLDRVFFSDSGSVAVEVALKMAVQYWQQSRCARPHARPCVSQRLSWRHHRRDGGVRSGGERSRGFSRATAGATRCRSTGR
jgi:adenosylmethionine-8-amino-7-oxononanoate aminotransferase